MNKNTSRVGRKVECPYAQRGSFLCYFYAKLIVYLFDWPPKKRKNVCVMVIVPHLRSKTGKNLMESTSG